MVSVLCFHRTTPTLTLVLSCVGFIISHIMKKKLVLSKFGDDNEMTLFFVIFNILFYSIKMDLAKA